MRKSNKLPQFHKEAKDFLLSEEGGITEKKIVKLGLVMGALALMGNDASAVEDEAPAHSSHANGVHTSGFDRVFGMMGGSGNGWGTDAHVSSWAHASHSNSDDFPEIE